MLDVAPSARRLPAHRAALRLCFGSRYGGASRTRTWRYQGLVVDELARGHGEPVLVVDDEPEVASLLAEMLSSAGYRVDTAENGRVAIGKLAERPYDVVFSDLKMPVLDGPGFYREVAARDSKALRKFAFITGDTLGPSSARFLEETPAPCLAKPFRSDEVEAIVARILEGATVSR